MPDAEADLIETGLVDSLSFVAFLAELEREFDVHVALEDLELDQFRTVARIAAFVAKKTPQREREAWATG